MLPPGRAKLGTMPNATGSVPVATTGMVAVAALKSRVKREVDTMITSGWLRTTSPANSRNCSVRPSPEYRATARFRPSA
jgi:hypothetical protein